MKPIVIVTIRNRYHELVSNLRVLHNLSHHFREPPEIVIVWACPELTRLWLFEDLLEQGLIHKLLTRLPLEGEAEGRATTHPESHNIRMGLEYARTRGPDAYALVMTADITPLAVMISLVDDRFNAGEKAVLFHWENGCTRADVWHTNAFGVCLDEAYWPPISQAGHPDTLERQWGMALAIQELPGIVKSHNSRSRHFTHTHLSEGLPPYERRNRCETGNISLFVKGYVPLWRRIWQFVFGVRS